MDFVTVIQRNSHNLMHIVEFFKIINQSIKLAFNLMFIKFILIIKLIKKIKTKYQKSFVLF